MIRIAIVDDHKLFLESFTQLVANIRGVSIWGSYTSAEDFLQDLENRDEEPHVLLLDLKMKGLSGFDCLQKLKQSGSCVRVLIISMFDHDVFVKKAAQLGAMGFITKESESLEIERAILSMHEQGFYLPERLSKQLVSQIQANQSLMLNPQDLLTASELEVLKHIAQGLTAAQIGEKLYKSRRTIEGHKQKLLEKTGQSNTAALMVWAFQQGLLL